MNDASKKYHSTYTVKMVLFSLFLILLFVILLWLCRNTELFTTVFKSTQNNEFTVIIDAGHGGVDTGASGINGKNESILCLEISNKIANFLSASGIDVVMTRADDNMLSSKNLKLTRKQADLSGRVEFAESISNPVFVSIHMNTYPSANCVGSQIFYSPNSEESKLLADTLKCNISNLQTNNKRENMSAGTNIYILNKLNVPAVLIECGFLTNPEEEWNLNNPEYQKKLAMCIAKGIIEFTKEG